mgnify:FL=1
MKKRVRAALALLLAVCLCASLAAPAAAVDTVQTGPAAETAAETADSSAYGNSLPELIQQQFSGGVSKYDPDEVVNVIVQLEAPALLDKGSGKTRYSLDRLETADAQTLALAQEAVQATQQSVKAEVAALSDDVSFESSESFSLLINAFTVKVPYGELARIRSLDGVRSAFVEGSFSIPVTEPGYELYTDYSSGMIGLNETELLGLTGSGTLIAVLDTGIDYDHEAFATAPEGGLRYTQEQMKALVADNAALFQAKTQDGWDPNTYSPKYADVDVSQLRISDKIIYSFDYANADYDATADGGNHGVHVSGIAAGHTVKDGETTFRGVAPDAQLAEMKVFDSWSGQCQTTTLLAALEDCVLLDADVINMSLGSASGFDTDVSGILSGVLQKLEEAGIILAVAAGNDTNTAANNPLNPAGLPQVENPDHGIVASPSTYHAAFSVASVNNAMCRQNYLTLNDRKVPFTDAAEGSSAIVDLDQPLEVVAVPGVGAEEDYAGIDVTGKAALILRGEISFSDKVANAQSHGAAAALVYDNEDSAQLITMQIENASIPSAFIGKADGEAAAALLAAGETVTLAASADNVQIVTYPEAGLMSSFSSWGPTSTLSIKPEITAPGGNIYSTRPGNQYASMSGTSMACPEIAGASAVMIQYVKEQQLAETKADRAMLIQSLMMSTANPVAAENGLPASVRQQGAGLVNLKDAVSSGAVLRGADGSLPKAELGSSGSGSYQFTFTVENFSDRPVSYSTEAVVLSDSAVTEDGISYYSGVPQDITMGAQVTFSVEDGLLLGDVNQDGVTDSRDARLIRRHVAGKTELSTEALRVADVDGDGLVTNTDASFILRAMAELGTIPEKLFTVPAHASAAVTVTLTLSDEQAAKLLQEFPQGAFVEGYVTLNGLGGTEDLNLPYLGYLGDWEDQQLFDSTYYDEEDALVYDGYAVAINRMGDGNFLGFNYFTQSFDGSKLYFSPDSFGTGNTFLYSEVTLLRNAENVTFTVADAEGNTLYTSEYGPGNRTYFVQAQNAFASTVDPTYQLGYGEQTFEWPADGEQLIYTVSASHEGSDQVQTLTFPAITMDTTMPTMSCETVYDDASDAFNLVLTMQDNGHLQGARISGIMVDQWGFKSLKEIAFVSGPEITEAEPNSVVRDTVELPQLQQLLASEDCLLDQIYVEVVDYAWNTYSTEVQLSGSHFTTEDNSGDTVTITRYSGVSTSLEIPSEIDGKTVTAIGADAFAGAPLSSVTIPETVTAIGAGAFQGTDLTWVKVPASVAEIGEKAFGYDADGQPIVDFTLCVAPGSTAEAYAKANNFALEYFTESGLRYEILTDAETGDQYASIITYDGTDPQLVIPETLQDVPVTEIGYRAFLENAVITGVTLPSTLKKIGDRAFMFTNVGDIDLPAGLEIIEEGAFAQMPNLTAINIPGGVKELPYMVFYNDVNLASVTLNEGLEKIGSDVFSSCSGLKSLILPDTVKELGENTFQNCTSLASINFPAGLTYIPYACFDNAGLTTLTIPENIVSIGGGAFGRCAKLTSVTLPASLTALGEQFGAGVFNGCSALTEVNFAENGKLTMIGAFTFNGCTSLTQITIPETVTSIEYCAFSESGLTSVDIPASVEKIAGQAFYLCNSLKTITLHEGLISVDSMAFTGCTSVKEISLPRSLTTIGNNAFGYANWSNKVEGFTIHGYAGTAAETYATENGFTFEAIAE